MNQSTHITIDSYASILALHILHKVPKFLLDKDPNILCRQTKVSDSFTLYNCFGCIPIHAIHTPNAIYLLGCFKTLGDYMKLNLL